MKLNRFVRRCTSVSHLCQHHPVDLFKMKLSQTTALALLAIDSAFALKEARRQSDDTTVRITLSSQSTETGTQVSFDAVNSRVYDSPRGSTLFETIDIFVGAGAQQDLRCQAIGMAGAPLVATRGNNTYVSSRLQEYTVRSFADIRTGSDITFVSSRKPELRWKRY